MRITTPLVILFLGLVLFGPAVAQDQDPPFGGEDDVAFAQALWKEMDGYMEWPMRSGVYPGTSPHGKFLRLYSNVVNVDGESYVAIVKDNFAGEDASAESVERAAKDYLAAVTVMVQRDSGYDPEHGDWYWVKYLPDGSLDQNAAGAKMAGRVAAGSSRGCISCHANAAGGDFVFTNDE